MEAVGAKMGGMVRVVVSGVDHSVSQNIGPFFFSSDGEHEFCFAAMRFGVATLLAGRANTLLELSGKVQELQNEVNCMNDSQDFHDAGPIRGGNSYVTSRPVSFPPHPIPEAMLRYSFVTPCRREGPPSIWDTHGISGNVFANPDASSSAPFPQAQQFFSHLAESWRPPDIGGMEAIAALGGSLGLSRGPPLADLFYPRGHFCEDVFLTGSIF